MIISSLLDLIDAVAAERAEEFQTVLKITRLDPTSPLIRILSDDKRTLNRQHFRHLLEKTVGIVRNHNVRSSVNDWPFENFWGSRIHEPRHSKLLGFFIDPSADKVGHRSGKPLLKRFLETLVPGCVFNLNGCSVDTEIKRTQFGQIDLLITRQCGDADDFGVIVENKVNNAPNAEQQLWRYVSWLVSEGLPRDRVYVRYLPLTPDKRPNSKDVAAIKSIGVDFAEVSFMDHILPWLEDVIENWPSDLDLAMRDNLCHYRNFILYLVNNKYRKLRMNTDILNKLKDSDIDITSLASGIQQLKASTEALEECLLSAQSGAMLMGIYRLLVQKGEKPWLCMQSEPFAVLESASFFDACFQQCINVCLGATEGVSVCFGSSPQDDFWFGYMRRRESDVQEAFLSVISSEAEHRCSKEKIEYEDDPYYAWWYKRKRSGDEREEHLALIFAEELIDMRQGLLRGIGQLKSGKSPRR